MKFTGNGVWKVEGKKKMVDYAGEEIKCFSELNVKPRSLQIKKRLIWMNISWAA